MPGYEARGGAKVEWDPKTRALKTAWQSTTNFASNVPTISRVNGILYTWGARNGEWTLEGTDWKTGKSAFRYTLGKSQRYNPMGAAIILDPDGGVICADCGLGLVRVKPKETKKLK